MPGTRGKSALTALIFGLIALAADATAAQPRNPYSGFNLSGVNYGAQQWDRAQREGRRVWPYFNVPTRVVSGRSAVAAGAGVPAAVFRTSPPGGRRWRR